MEEKEIDIDNEEQILNECDFDYFYNLEKCSRELCMFYNDIIKQKNNFNTKQAIIDLGRIAITLNQQDKRIKELEEQLSTATMYHGCETLVNELKQKNQQLKKQLHELPKKIVGEIKKELYDCGRTYLEDEPYIEICIVKGILDTILKKFGGENE